MIIPLIVLMIAILLFHYYCAFIIVADKMLSFIFGIVSHAALAQSVITLIVSAADIHHPALIILLYFAFYLSSAFWYNARVKSGKIPPAYGALVERLGERLRIKQLSEGTYYRPLFHEFDKESLQERPLETGDFSVMTKPGDNIEITNRGLLQWAVKRIYDFREFSKDADVDLSLSQLFREFIRTKIPGYTEEESRGKNLEFAIDFSTSNTQVEKFCERAGIELRQTAMPKLLPTSDEYRKKVSEAGIEKAEKNADKIAIDNLNQRAKDMVLASVDTDGIPTVTFAWAIEKVQTETQKMKSIRVDGNAGDFTKGQSLKN